MESNTHLAILSAMPEEVGTILENLSNTESYKFGDLTIYRGFWLDKKNNREILISTAWSGWGKVCAARAATRLLSLSNNLLPIDLLIFTGVAGAIKNHLNQWDLILPTEVVQYDLDASPLFEKFEIPALKKKFLKPAAEIHSWAFQTLKNCIKTEESMSIFGNLFDGVVGTADKFISNEKDRIKIEKDLPSIQVVEMEGAAVAQVAYQEKVPWLLLRVVSDSADKDAEINFSRFLEEYKIVSWKLIEILLENYK